jgi:colanic acid/amylovoran biosynthesis glycosyltransferase
LLVIDWFQHVTEIYVMPERKLHILHSCPVWLPLTQTWLYHQVDSCRSVHSHVVCRRTENLDQFGGGDIHVYEGSTLARRAVDVLKRRRWIGNVAHVLDRTVLNRFKHRTLEVVRAKILHSHFGMTGWRDRNVAARTGVKQVVTFYGLDVGFMPCQEPRWYRRYRQMFDTVDSVLCEGPHMAQCVERLGCPSHKVHVHHLGIDVDAIHFEPRSWSRPETLQVLIAASFSEKKGIPYALDAVGRLSREHPVEVTLIGGGPDTPRVRAEKQRIDEAIARHGLEQRVRFLGYVPHARLLEESYRHHVFISPSVTAETGDTEGGAPITILEMLATGMPVVSTTHCDIPEVIRHGQDGLLADERDVDGLVAHLRWLVAHPDRWKDIATSARARVEKEFNAKIQGQRLAEHYHSLVQ